MYLKQCDEYVSRVLCPAFMNFGYAPWKTEVEEMYGSDLERSTGEGGKAVAQNAEFRVRPGDNDVTTKSGTSASLARGRRKGRATQARSLAKRVKPMEVLKTFHRHAERVKSDSLSFNRNTFPLVSRAQKAVGRASDLKA